MRVYSYEIKLMVKEDQVFVLSGEFVTKHNNPDLAKPRGFRHGQAAAEDWIEWVVKQVRFIESD